jgi:hypothetical protein
LETTGPAAKALRKFQDVKAACGAQTKSDEKSLRRAERSALGYLNGLRTDCPLNREPNRWAIQSAAARLARVSGATGESFEQVCNRLGIAETHRKAMLAIPGAGSRKLRSLHAKDHAPAPAVTLNDKVVGRNERTALGYLRDVSPGRPLDGYSNKAALQRAAGRLAAVCEATGQRFAMVCERLRISELNKNALLNIPGTGSERLRKFHNGRWSHRTSDHVPAVKHRYAVLNLLSGVIAGCPPDVEPNKSRYSRAADRVAKLCSAMAENFFEVCDWLKLSEEDRIALLELPDPDRRGRRSGERHQRPTGYSGTASGSLGAP